MRTCRVAQKATAEKATPRHTHAPGVGAAVRRRPDPPTGAENRGPSLRRDSPGGPGGPSGPKADAQRLWSWLCRRPAPERGGGGEAVGQARCPPCEHARGVSPQHEVSAHGEREAQAVRGCGSGP